MRRRGWPTGPTPPTPLVPVQPNRYTPYTPPACRQNFAGPKYLEFWRRPRGWARAPRCPRARAPPQATLCSFYALLMPSYTGCARSCARSLHCSRNVPSNLGSKFRETQPMSAPARRCPCARALTGPLSSHSWHTQCTPAPATLVSRREPPAGRAMSPQNLEFIFRGNSTNERARAALPPPASAPHQATPRPLFAPLALSYAGCARLAPDSPPIAPVHECT